MVFYHRARLSGYNRGLGVILSVLLVFLLALQSRLSAAESLSATDQLLSRLLTVNLPSPLFKNPKVNAQFGYYDVEVELAGAAKVMSYPQNVKVSLPMNVTMKAVLSALPVQNPDGTPFSCTSQFQTTAQLTVLPNFQSERVTTQTQLNLPVPQTNANCGVMQIPLQSMLQAMVDANQAQWEKNFNTEIEKQLNPQTKAKPALNKPSPTKP